MLNNCVFKKNLQTFECLFCVCVLIQTVNQEHQEVKLQLTTEREKVSDLLNKLKELEVKADSSFPFQPSSE